MTKDVLLEALKECSVTLKGVLIEFKNNRTYTASSNTFILHTLKAIQRLLHRIEAEVTKRITQGDDE